MHIRWRRRAAAAVVAALTGSAMLADSPVASAASNSWTVSPICTLTGQNWWQSGTNPWYADSSAPGCTVTGVAFNGYSMYWASGTYAWTNKGNPPPASTKHGAYDYIYGYGIPSATLACC